MLIKIYSKEDQAYGAFNNGQIVENKPLGFPQDGGELRPYSNIFYWANAIAKTDSTIGLHPHQGFEILSFVLEGKIRHFDTKLNEWKWLSAGDVQMIQAGNGISHAEHMESGSRMFQIWLDPDLGRTLEKEANYMDFKSDVFQRVIESFYEKIVYSGKNGKMQMDTEGVEIGRMKMEGDPLSWPVEKSEFLSIYVLSGILTVNGSEAREDEFILINESEIENLDLSGKAEWFYIKSPLRPGYSTYSEIMQQRMGR